MADGTPVDDLEGRELDAAVAEEVVGERVCDDPTCKPWGGLHLESEGHELPHYSTYIAAAWQVVERLNAMGYYVSPARTTDGRGFCEIMPSDQWVGDGIRAGPCDSTPEAICRAALKAIRSSSD